MTWTASSPTSPAPSAPSKRARRLGIGTAACIDDALDILQEATAPRERPRLLHQLAQLVGWK